MPKRTLQQVADKHGITRDQLQALGAKGVNKWNDDEVAQAVKKLRPRVSSNTKLSGARQAVMEAAASMDLTALEKSAYHADSYEEARLITEKLKGVRAAIAAKKELGELIKLAEVDERDTKIGAATRAALMKLSNDMPTVLEGLSAKEIKRRLSAAIKETLSALADMQSEFWKDKERPK